MTKKRWRRSATETVPGNEVVEEPAGALAGSRVRLDGRAAATRRQQRLAQRGCFLPWAANRVELNERLWFLPGSRRTSFKAKHSHDFVYSTRPFLECMSHGFGVWKADATGVAPELAIFSGVQQ